MSVGLAMLRGVVLLLLPILTVGCATFTLSDFGHSYEAVTNYNAAYSCGDYLIVEYTAEQLSSKTNSPPGVELKRCVFVKLKRDQPPSNTGNSIRNSEIPQAIRTNGKELPLVIVDLPAQRRPETPESASTAPLYVYVGRTPNTQLNTFWICRTNAVGQKVCSPVGGLYERRTWWATPVFCLGFPVTVAVDVATAPVWLPAAIWFKRKYPDFGF
jgi:hypothetical protein